MDQAKNEKRMMKNSEKERKKRKERGRERDQKVEKAFWKRTKDTQKGQSKYNKMSFPNQSEHKQLSFWPN